MFNQTFQGGCELLRRRHQFAFEFLRYSALGIPTTRQPAAVRIASASLLTNLHDTHILFAENLMELLAASRTSNWRNQERPFRL